MVYSTDKKKGKKFWVCRAFDCQDMPDKVRDEFFKEHSGSNGDFVPIYVYDEHKPKENVKNPANVLFTNRYGNVIEKGDYPVEDWLYANGAKKGSRVLVCRWW